MNVFSDVERECLVEAKTTVADGVVALDLVAANGRDLPPWEPGAHIDLILHGGVERQYSVCGDPADRTRYRVAILREPHGRGGTRFVHDDLATGDAIRIRGPRNHFAFVPAADVLFIAGGIGITPLVAMCRAAHAAGIRFRLLYAGRSRSSMAFLGDLEAEYGGRVEVFAGDEGARLDVAATVSALPDGVQVYCCGPARLLDAVEAAWSERTDVTALSSLHLEHFEAKEFGPPVLAETFQVELALTGVTVEVPPDRSVLDVVEEQGVLVVSSCRKGTCGTCETPVLDGEIDHRDSVLTPGEQAAGDTMMICVSRAATSDGLVLDL